MVTLHWNNKMKVLDGGIKRKYYKWGAPNATIVGSPTIEDGVVSGFTSSSYLKLPSQFSPGSKPWEIVFCVEDVGTTNGYIMSAGYYGTSQQTTYVNIFVNLGGGAVKPGYASMSPGFGYPNNYHSIYAPFTPTAKQWIKCEFTGSAYNIYISDTATFSTTPSSSWTSSSAISHSYPANFIGLGPAGTGALQGKLYLKESYIKIDGGIWWQGCSIEEADETDYDWYEDVETYIAPEITETRYYKITDMLNPQITQYNGTLSNGSYTGVSGSYLLLPQIDLNGADSWEFQTSFTYTYAGSYPTVISPSTSAYGLHIMEQNRAIYLTLSYGGTSSTLIQSGTPVTSTLVEGTTYYIKCGYDGTQYYFDWNTDGSETYTRGYSLTSSLKVYSGVPYYLANWGYNTGTYYFPSTLNLKKTVFYLNGRKYLTGTVIERSTSSDYDFSQQEKVYYGILF